MKMCVGKATSMQPFELQETLAGDGIKSIKYLKQEDEDCLEYTEDILSVSTYYTKAVLFGLSELYSKFRNSVFYKILFHTTQPAHIVVALAVSIVAYLLFSNKDQTVPFSPLWTFTYLVSVSTHFGNQIWMTFVSGLALYFSLPRHTFGSVQRVLFPKYFLLNAGLSLVTLAVFVRHQSFSSASTKILVQTATLTICFLVELVIRLYLTPPLLYLMEQKNNIEKEVGVGMEVGKHDPGVLVNCPHYLQIHKAFRKVHMTIAIGNIITMACTVIHLHYLASKICVL